MPSEPGMLIGIGLGALFAFLVLAALFSALVLTPMRVRHWFEQLEFEGYSAADPGAPEVQAALRAAFPEAADIRVIRAAVRSHRGRTRCMARVRVSKPGTEVGEGTVDSCVVAAETGPSGVSADVVVVRRLKITLYVRMLEELHGSELTEDLAPRFAEAFTAFSKAEGPARLPRRLQEALVGCMEEGPPFQAKAGATFRAGPQGWSIAVTGAPPRGWLDGLTRTADAVSAAIG